MDRCEACGKRAAWTPCMGCRKALCEGCAHFELLAEGCGTVVPAYFCETCIADPLCNPNAIFWQMKASDP